MQFSGSSPNYKKCLLPLVMAVALFFISQGITVPTFANLLEPQLSGSHKSKYSDSVSKAPRKCSQTKSAKTDNSFAAVSYAPRINNPAVPVSVHHYQAPRFLSAAVSAIPARAPPA
jgi:hypothetical protein